MNEVIIRSSQSGASITFSARKDLCFQLRFDSPEISYGKTIDGYLYQQDLIRLFDAMAASWKGWEGTMTWSSLENDMHLSCSHDGLGHIDLELSLWHQLGQPEPWQATAHLVIDAVQLDRIAFDLRQFFA